MCFLNYRIRKKLLDKCLKSSVSDDPSKSYKVNQPKNSCIQDDSTFTIFTYHSEGNWVGKSLI